MLGSITPLGERSRGRRWGVTVMAFALAAVAAGGAAGAVLGEAGGRAGLAAGTRTALLAVAVAAAIAVDAVPGLHPPGPGRQVNEEWLQRYRGWVYGAGFGAQLGLGVTTIVTTAAVYAAIAAAVLSGEAAGGAAVGAAFGAARAVTLLATAGVREPRALATLDRRLRSWERPARLGALAVEAVLVVVAALAVT
jgi:hypothetical protein